MKREVEAIHTWPKFKLGIPKTFAPPEFDRTNLTALLLAERDRLNLTTEHDQEFAREMRDRGLLLLAHFWTNWIAACDDKRFQREASATSSQSGEVETQCGRVSTDGCETNKNSFL